MKSYKIKIRFFALVQDYNFFILNKYLIIIPFFLCSCVQIPYSSKANVEAPKYFKVNSNLENKGKYVTSAGELKVLFIFAQFNDDTTTKSDEWKFDKNNLPAWTKKIINNSQILKFPEDNITQYFYEMSNGNLMLYGDVYHKPVIPKFNQEKYKSIAEVNSEILTRLDDEIDYSKYDNWTKGKDGKYVNKPDGKVDMIFIVYRNFEDKLYFNNGWTGIAQLHLVDEIKTNDDVVIAKGRLDSGSGISSRGGKNGFTFMKYVLAHEFGHFLFGAGHIENITNLGLMTGGPVWNASRGMHSWEKAWLGWLDFIDVPTNKNTKIKISDFHSTGEVFRIKLSDNEWYLIENHQKISKHDYAADEGVYIYHIRNAKIFSPIINVKCADGIWDFEIDEANQKLIKTFPNPNGKSEMNFSRRIKKKSFACYNEVYGDNSAWGDEYDAYDLTYNNLYSPVSNPSSKNYSKIDFAIEVIDKIEGVYTVNVLFENIYENTPPSKPHVLDLKSENGKKHILSWLQNGEPDLKGYNIYLFNKLKNSAEKYNYIAAKKGNEVMNYDVSNLITQKQNTPILFITAIDNSGKESVRSNYAEIYFDKSKNIWTWNRIEQF